MSNTKQPKQYSQEELQELLKNAISPEDKEKIQLKELAAGRAMADPLPGAAYDAMLAEDIEVETTIGKVNVRPNVAYDWVIFKQINSPVYNLTLESGMPKEIREEVDFKEQQAFELIYQFTHSCKEIRNLLRKGNGNIEISNNKDEKYAVFREEVLNTTADKYSVFDIKPLINAVMQQILKSSSSALEYGVVKKDEVQSAEFDADGIPVKKN